MSNGSNRGGAGWPSGAQEIADFQAFAASYGGTTISKTKPGTVIYAQGDPSDCLYYIKDGWVRIRVVSPQGKTAIMANLDDDAIFGETCLLGESARVATAVCVSDCTLVRMTKTDAVRALRDNPRFAEFILKRVLRRVTRLRSRLVSHLFEGGEQRLARILLTLATGGRGLRDKRTVIEGLDQEDLAQMVGTTRARINHFMNKFRDLGYIDYNGNIAVHRSLSNVLANDFGNQGGVSDSV
ncbi:MAG TPA: Crp/Fnr family transcriptional regulator [Xanthobacteraceae bacterium]|nr:Crp/Fnr family transcriptional regulator [Xanthobacteraceae bacterium]